MEKILFINFGGLGDEILFLPAIKSVKNKYANAKITLVLEKRSSSIKNLVPYIDNIICADIKAGKIKKYFEILKMLFNVWGKNYDMAISSGKSPFIAIILCLTGIKKRIGYKTGKFTDKFLTKAVELKENQYAGKMYFDLVKELEGSDYNDPKINLNNSVFQNSELPDNFVAIHPGVSKMSIAKNIYKCPSADFWADLINSINTKGKNVVLLGGPDDREIIEEIKNKTDKFINMFGKTKNIMDLAHIISMSDKFICVDSAPMHIGVALNKDIIALFGPTNEEKLIPKKDNFHVVTANTDCRPCLWDKRADSCENKDCLKFDINKILELI